MSKLSLVRCILTLLSIAFTLPALAITPGEEPQRFKFTTLQDFMVIVPVSINGTGPFRFLFDTGTSRTMVDRQIANRLSLPGVGQSIAVGIEDTASISLVHADFVSMAGFTVPGLTLTVLPKNAGLPEKVSGILGEDFLEQFDLLIDYRHHLIELQSGGGPLGDALAGERLPVRLEGMMEDGPVIGRLILSAHARELGRKDVSLLLDSGVSSLVVFGGPQSLGAGAVQQNLDITGSLPPSTGVSAYAATIEQLWLGNKMVRNVTALAPPAKRGMDTDGILPTSVFGSIFISHSHRFVILDPTAKAMARQEK